MKRINTNEKQVQSTSVLKENYLRTYLSLTKAMRKKLKQHALGISGGKTNQEWVE